MNMKRFLTLFLCVVALACSKKPEQAAKKEEPPKKIVLEMGTLKLSDQDVNLMFKQLPLEQKNRYLANKDKAKQDFVEDLAEKQLFVLAARESKMPEKPETQATLEMAENSVLYSAYYRSEILDKVVPENEIRAFYDANKDRFFHPEQVHVRHILVTPRGGAKINNTTGDDAKTEAEAKKKIEKLIADLKAGAKFDDLARQYSEDPSAAQGGVMDWLSPGRTIKAFEEAAFSIPSPGQIAGPVKSEYGYHLIQLLEKRERIFFNYEDVRDEIQTQLSGQKGEQVQKAYEKLVTDLKVKYPRKITMSNLQ